MDFHFAYFDFTTPTRERENKHSTSLGAKGCVLEREGTKSFPPARYRGSRCETVVVKRYPQYNSNLNTLYTPSPTRSRR